MLKDLLTSAPVLTYPRVEDPFILETDASILGLGAILSQCWPNPPFKRMPVAHSTKQSEIMESRTLAVV